jgi:hypothetical protein
MTRSSSTTRIRLDRISAAQFSDVGSSSESIESSFVFTLCHRCGVGFRLAATARCCPVAEGSPVPVAAPSSERPAKATQHSHRVADAAWRQCGVVSGDPRAGWPRSPERAVARVLGRAVRETRVSGVRLGLKGVQHGRRQLAAWPHPCPARGRTAGPACSRRTFRGTGRRTIAAAIPSSSFAGSVLQGAVDPAGFQLHLAPRAEKGARVSSPVPNRRGSRDRPRRDEMKWVCE